MLLRNEQTGEEIRLWWEDDLVLTQRTNGGVVAPPNDRKRPSRLAAQVEALRLCDKFLSQRFAVIDPTTPCPRRPADRRATPLLPHPPWLDPEAASVETDRLLELGDPLAEIVAGAPDLVWVPEVTGALSDSQPLIELQIEHGHARAASVLVHLDERQLTAALRRLFGVGGRGHVLAVLLGELASLEITRYLERITLTGLTELGSITLLDGFEHLKSVSIEPAVRCSSLWLGAIPHWMTQLEELRLNVDIQGQTLFQTGSTVRRLMTRAPGRREIFATMTRERWPNLTELSLSVVAPEQALSGLAESGLLDELTLLDLSRCAVSAAGAQDVERELARHPDLIVRRPVVTDRVQRRIAGLDAHPRQQAIDDLASSPEIAYEARRLAFEDRFYGGGDGFRDSGGDELELWAYHEAGLTELRLADGHTTCECANAQPCVHVLALMYRAVHQDKADWLKR